MPIYAYKCDSCGFSKDVLQKFSDAALTDCPSCGVSSFHKQLTAPGFQLKGSGWYATDFKGAKAGTPAPAGAADPVAAPKDGGSTAPDTGASKTEAAAAGCAASCACH